MLKVFICEASRPKELAAGVEPRERERALALQHQSVLASKELAIASTPCHTAQSGCVRANACREIYWNPSEVREMNVEHTCAILCEVWCVSPGGLWMPLVPLFFLKSSQTTKG